MLFAFLMTVKLPFWYSFGFYRILGVLWSKKISFSMPEARSLCDPAEVAHLQLECRQF
jgi:hypothetical protein